MPGYNASTTDVAHKDSARIVISVDAMGGDRGPAAVVAGLVICAASLPDVAFVVHGDEAALSPLIDRQTGLTGRVTLRHAARVVSMEDKPSPGDAAWCGHLDVGGDRVRFARARRMSRSAAATRVP